MPPSSSTRNSCCCTCKLGCLQGRDDIVYRSGRVRSPGETNGKACNLNNTLHWLYPKEKCVADEEVSNLVAALVLSFDL